MAQRGCGRGAARAPYAVPAGWRGVVGSAPHWREGGGFPVGSGDFLPNPLKFLSFALYLNEAALKHF